MSKSRQALVLAFGLLLAGHSAHAAKDATSSLPNTASPNPQPTEDVLKKPYGKSEGVAGPFVFGPSMSLLAIPHPLEVGIESKYDDTFGLSVNYGFMPTINIRDANINMTSLSIALRWFPFHGAFFIGGTAGTQDITGTKAQTIQGVPVHATVDVNSSYYIPQIGWRWVWETGFFMGVDMGWQFASSAQTKVTTDLSNPVLLATPEYASLTSDIQKTGNDIGNKGLPSLTVLHFGWFF